MRSRWGVGRGAGESVRGLARRWPRDPAPARISSAQSWAFVVDRDCRVCVGVDEGGCSDTSLQIRALVAIGWTRVRSCGPRRARVTALPCNFWEWVACGVQCWSEGLVRTRSVLGPGSFYEACVADWEFNFDRVLHNQTQEAVFNDSGKAAVLAAIGGVNQTIMAFGTLSSTTHTHLSAHLTADSGTPSHCRGPCFAQGETARDKTTPYSACLSRSSDAVSWREHCRSSSLKWAATAIRCSKLESHALRFTTTSSTTSLRRTPSVQQTSQSQTTGKR